jgi:hypothetical protein
VAAAESRPAALPSAFDVPAGGEPWRKGDSVAFALDFEDGDVRESFWLMMEVTRAPAEGSELARASVRTTMLELDGTEIGKSLRRVTPSRIRDSSHEIFAAYAAVVAAAAAGEPPEQIQESIDEDMSEGSTVDEARRTIYREMRRTVAPRFVRNRLKEPAINSSIGSISVLDLALSALAPAEVLVDVNRLNEEQSTVADFADIPVAPLRIPFVVTVGGAIQFRFAVTLAPPEPPYGLAGGIIEIAGVNEARGDRRFLIRLIGAKRGPPVEPESRPNAD